MIPSARPLTSDSADLAALGLTDADLRAMNRRSDGSEPGDVLDGGESGGDDDALQSESESSVGGH